MIEAKTVLDSVSPQGHRLFCVKARYPKFIHGELMTHRVFSRNASSSRAVPTAKLIEEVRSDVLRAGPIHWGAAQKGMGAEEELSDQIASGHVYSARMLAEGLWAEAAMLAAEKAEQMAALGAAKQLVNRLLEPFSHINVLISATEWDNFFGLRLDRAAQPEMRSLAEAIWREWNESRPTLLKPGQWHLPFVSDYEIQLAFDMRGAESCPDGPIGILRRVSVARCARVSYESFETGKRSTVEEDLALYDRLLGAQPLHASPAEHQATPDELSSLADGHDHWDHPDEHGNFTGWRQYRKMLPGEDCAPLPAGYEKEKA